MEIMKSFYDDICKYRDAKNIEIEVRLGKINHGIFDSNIGKQKFQKLLNALHKYKEWECVKKNDDEVYYWDNGVRCIYDGEKSEYQKKNKIMKKDMVMNPLDIRMSVSQEIPIQEPNEDAKHSVHRHRTSFLRKNVRIDCTVVTGDPEDKDSEDVEQYQVELEFLDLSNDQLIFSALHKVKDLLACL